MIRFCTEAGTKQPENGPLLLYWSRQQMEADRQVSRSYRIGNAIVTRASRRKESKKKGGASNFWSPLDCTLLPSGARWLCQLFKKSNSCWEREHFSWFCFPRHDPRAVREEPGRQRGWTRKAKAQHLWGLGHRSATPPPGTCGPFLFLTCHTQCPPSYREPGAEPARRGGRRPHPAKGRLTCSRGRRKQAGRQGEAGAARRATRETGRREGPRLGRRGGQSPGYSLLGARCPEPSCHALDVRGNGRLRLGASRVL